MENISEDRKHRLALWWLAQVGVPQEFRKEIARYPIAGEDEAVGCVAGLAFLFAFGAMSAAQFVVLYWFERYHFFQNQELGTVAVLLWFTLNCLVASAASGWVVRRCLLRNRALSLKRAAAKLRQNPKELVPRGAGDILGAILLLSFRPCLNAISYGNQKAAVRRALRKARTVDDLLLVYALEETRNWGALTGGLTVIGLISLLILWLL